MNQYFSKYVREDLLSNDHAEFSTEVSTFIKLYEDAFAEDEEIMEIINDRKILQGAIADIMEKLKAIPSSTQK